MTLASSDGDQVTSSETSVTFAAGQASATVDLTGVADGIVDGDQTVTVTASAPDTASAGDTITVLDIDAPPAPLEISIALDDAAIDEGTSTSFTVTRQGGDLNEDLTINLAVDGLSLIHI